jgi:hypothetical protein
MTLRKRLEAFSDFLTLVVFCALAVAAISYLWVKLLLVVLY